MSFAVYRIFPEMTSTNLSVSKMDNKENDPRLAQDSVAVKYGSKLYWKKEAKQLQNRLQFAKAQIEAMKVVKNKVLQEVLILKEKKNEAVEKIAAMVVDKKEILQEMDKIRNDEAVAKKKVAELQEKLNKKDNLLKTVGVGFGCLLLSGVVVYKFF